MLFINVSVWAIDLNMKSHMLQKSNFSLNLRYTWNTWIGPYIQKDNQCVNNKLFLKHRSLLTQHSANRMDTTPIIIRILLLFCWSIASCLNSLDEKKSSIKFFNGILLFSVKSSLFQPLNLIILVRIFFYLYSKYT